MEVQLEPISRVEIKIVAFAIGFELILLPLQHGGWPGADPLGKWIVLMIILTSGMAGRCRNVSNA